jgi:hypothetical protein
MAMASFSWVTSENGRSKHTVVPSSFNKMVHRWLITPKTMVYYTYNHITIVFMGFINQLVPGGHHIVGNSPAKMGDLSNNMQNADG